MAASENFVASLQYSLNRLGIQFKLKEKQTEALKSIWNGKDTVVMLPTGYGKSLIFQCLPFLLQRRYQSKEPMIVIVVTPLNSIMHDQVSSLCASGIPACFLDVGGDKASSFQRGDTRDASNGSDSEVDTEALLEDEDIVASVSLDEIKKGDYFLIYAHPETLLEKTEVARMLRSKVFRQKVCCTVIDEVHMVTEWGTEFRKAFGKLGQLTSIFPKIPHVAMTATATQSILKTLCNDLEFTSVNIIQTNPDRPNIFLDIRRDKLPSTQKEQMLNSILEEMVDDLKDQQDRYPVTIMYVDTLEMGHCYKFLERKLGLQAYIPRIAIPENRLFGQFHKKYTKEVKDHIISELRKEQPKIRIIFATIALGMGLNAPCISKILHFRPPTSLEKYMQEIGRAGRRGQKAHAVCWYNNSDLVRKGMDRSTVPAFFRNKTDCLRLKLLEYFGFEEAVFNGPRDECCSNCVEES